MLKQLIIIGCVLGIAQLAFSKMVVREITPVTAGEVKWTVATQSAQDKTTFQVAIPFKNNVLPPGVSVQVDVLDGTNLVSTLTPQLQVLEGKSCFVFVVSNKYLPDSKFSLTKLDIPHPSGDLLWINLGKFVEMQRDQNPEQSSPLVRLSRDGKRCRKGVRARAKRR